MPANALVKYLLWDFGDTLATWRGGNPEWTEAYAAIDQSNLDAWIARGGLGYLYAGDKKFQEDVANGIDGLITK